MTATTGASETWQARISRDLAAQLRRDAEVLGLEGRTEIVKAALGLLHRRAAEERMARSVDDFYRGAEPPLPIGVRPAVEPPADAAS
jgi:vacuolar-type H+-ATPase subunit B/Vma2